MLIPRFRSLMAAAAIAPHRIRFVQSPRYRWCVTLAAGDIFGPNGPDPDAWVRDGLATVIKQGSQRTVYRVQLPGGLIFVKRCRINGFRAWLRELVRSPKARLEFENAMTLRDRGLPAVEPLAWGRLASKGPGESIFITRAEDEAAPLQRLLDEQFPTISEDSRRQLRSACSTRLGTLMARLHDAGVAHPDPHPGNLLATLRSTSDAAITLIDLHAIRFGRPLSWSESLENLVLFNRWFQLRATRTDRHRFWQAYVRGRTTLPVASPMLLGQMAVEVERRTENSNARFWMSRFNRYRKSSRHVMRIDLPRFTGFAVHDIPVKFVERLAADPEAMLRDPAARVLKDSHTSTVIELPMPTAAGPRRVILKRFRPRSALSSLKNLVRPSAAMRSWLYGHNLLDRGLPTPRPLCVIERRTGTTRPESYLLTEMVEDARPLHEAAAAADWKTVRAATARVGRLLHLLHGRRVRHRDLKASNILITNDLEPVLIDLVGVTPCAGHLPRGVRVRDIARLAASFHQCPAVSRTDKLRVLRAYRAWGLRHRGDWKAWWREVEAAIDRKRAKNARRGRPLA